MYVTVPITGLCGTPSTVTVSVWPDMSRSDEFRKAEVEDLHPAVSRDEEVLGLDVAMHDAAIVAGRETVAICLA